MRARIATVVMLLLLLLPRSVALAWDPMFDGGADAPVSTPTPPPGLYLVTDVYAGDVVTTSGATTTYGTVTVRDTPGTYARVLGTAGTGETTALDGASLNTRASLPDGRLVAGTYYEDFVLTARGYVSVNVVFFQDDALTATQVGRSTRAPATPAPRPTAATPALSTNAPATPAPIATPTSRPGTPVVTPRPAPAATPRPARTTPRPVSGTAGVALASTGPVLASIEVLRGRVVRLWPRVFVNGRAASVATWRIVAIDGASASPSAAYGSTPCEVVWTRLAPARSSFSVVFDVSTPALPGRTLRATLRVVVRSPALVE